jgi:hypothetical protein
VHELARDLFGGLTGGNRFASRRVPEAVKARQDAWWDATSAVLIIDFVQARERRRPFPSVASHSARPARGRSSSALVRDLRVRNLTVANALGRRPAPVALLNQSVEVRPLI